MKKASISELKVSLSEYLKRLKPDEVLQICKRNVPIAEIRLLKRTGAKGSKQPMAWGSHKGIIKLERDFFEPLPEKFLAEFYGESV